MMGGAVRQCMYTCIPYIHVHVHVYAVSLFVVGIGWYVPCVNAPPPQN